MRTISKQEKLKSIGKKEPLQKKTSKIKKDYFGAFKGIGKFYKEDKFKCQFEE